MGRPGRELGTVMMWEQGHVIPTLGETANLWAAGEWAQLVQLEVGRRTGARWELAAVLPHWEDQQHCPKLWRRLRGLRGTVHPGCRMGRAPPLSCLTDWTGTGAGKSKIKPTRTRKETIRSLLPCLYCALLWPSFPSWPLCERNGSEWNRYQGLVLKGEFVDEMQ